MKITMPAFFRFGNFGDSISRYTCARDSSPLMASTEWPNAMKMAMTPNICGKLLCASQPSALGLNRRLRGCGSGGQAECLIAMVYTHQVIRMTTMTVTSFMMCRAFSLDSGMPLVFSHQKYTVTIIAKQEAMMSMDRGESGPVARCA